MRHGFGCGKWKLHWHQRHVVGVFPALCRLSSGCLVYGAWVAAVAAMVSVLAWACLGFSFFAFCVLLLNMIKQNLNLKRSQPVS